MKRIFIFILLFSLCFGVFAEDNYPFQEHKGMYALIGPGEFFPEAAESEVFGQQLVKIYFSMKYELFSEYNSGLFFGYSQAIFWDFFEESNPIVDVNYNPEFFYRFMSGHNLFGNAEVPGLRYIGFGTEHKSNGQSGASSRAFDRLFVDFELGAGDDVEIFIGAKYFQYYHDLFSDDTVYVDNLDITDYTGNFEFHVGYDANGKMIFFFPQSIRYTMGFGGGPHGFDITKGWHQIDLEFFDIFGGMKLFAQIWKGYGESLIDYDRENFGVRIGLLLN